MAVVLTLAVTSNCRLEGKRNLSASEPAPKISYKVRKLVSGKQIKVIGFRPLNSKPSTMMLDYFTDLDIYDSPSLEKEVEEIWADVQKDLPRGVTQVDIIPTEPPDRRKNAPVSALSKAFVYERCGDGWCKGSGFAKRE